MCSIVFRVIGAALSIISLFPAVGNSQSRENGTFQGICSVASISKEKGVQGIKAAKPLNQELFYSVSGNRDSIEVDWWGRKVIYNRKEAEGTFSSPNSATNYSSPSNGIVLLVFLDDPNRSPIFHTSSADETANTWGSCVLNWTTANEPSSTLRLVIPAVLDRLKKDDGTSFARLTAEGKLIGCELEFQHSYLDNRSQGGMPVALNGSFSVQFNSGKVPGYMLKINAMTFDPESTNWKLIKPAFSTALINGRNFDLNKITEFTCESGGRCVGYGDSDFGLMRTLISKPSLDATILLSLVKDGIDYRFSLSNLAKHSKKADDLANFKRCALEVADRAVKDLAR